MTPKAVECPKCKTVADFEYVVRGQQTMLELPVKYAPNERIDKLKVCFVIGISNKKERY